ncbi:hypothetical protein JCM12214_32410 [Geobacillus vulcani]
MPSPFAVNGGGRKRLLALWAFNVLLEDGFTGAPCRFAPPTGSLIRKASRYSFLSSLSLDHFT